MTLCSNVLRLLAGLALLSPCAVYAGPPPFAPNPEPEPADYTQPTLRNAQHRFGAQGTLSFGARAKFMSAAFSGVDIVALPATGPEEIFVDPSRDSAKENGAPGGEIYYERALGESDFLSEGVNDLWGFHIGVGYSNISLTSNTTVAGNHDVPILDGVGNPIGTNREFVANGQMAHDLDADLWYVNIGLFSESYLTDRLYAKVGGGLSVAYIDAEYEITGPFNFSRETADEQDILLGGYIDLTIGYDITENWGAYIGAKYQYLTTFDMDARFSDAELKFDQNYMVFLGLRFTF